MSTLPGDDALRDAGLTGPEIEDAVNLAEEVARNETDADAQAAETAQDAVDADAKDKDEYRPGTPRPDLAGEADEADVIEQSWTVPIDDDDSRT